jgi:rhodanese-related sulfurtransferase
MGLTAETALASLGLPHLAVVLDEMFYVPPPGLVPAAPPPPTTVGELAARTKLPVEGVIRYLEAIVRMSQDPTPLEISPAALAALLPEKPVLLDVREPWEFAICHLEGSILLDPETFPALLARLQGQPNVITICHHGVRSYSAALYLRERGVPARSLAGGVDLWAQAVDPQMARY